MEREEDPASAIEYTTTVQELLMDGDTELGETFKEWARSALHRFQGSQQPPASGKSSGSVDEHDLGCVEGGRGRELRSRSVVDLSSTPWRHSDFYGDFTDEFGELDEFLLPARQGRARNEYLFMDERVFAPCSWSEML